MIWPLTDALREGERKEGTVNKRLNLIMSAVGVKKLLLRPDSEVRITRKSMRLNSGFDSKILCVSCCTRRRNSARRMISSY